MIGDKERCLEAGMDEYVAKPLRRGDLLASIAKVLSPKTGGATITSLDMPPLFSR